MKALFVFAFMVIGSYSFGQQLPALRYADKIRIREAMNISHIYGDKIFKGYSEVPFAILLIADSTEFLMNHPHPSADFMLLGFDSVLHTNVYYRKEQFDKHLLATFPAVNNLSCIVVGTPENTNKTSGEWVITLLHEHFHQYQYSDTNYLHAVVGLNLSNGDNTGMWMLNYAFAYDSLPVINQYEIYTHTLYGAVNNIDSKNYDDYLKRYLTEREKFKALLPAADYRYFSFQIWQEGLARYTEYNFLQNLKDYQPSKEMQQLPDYIPFTQQRITMYNTQMKYLLERKLNEQKRVCFYTVGFAEGIILDKMNGHWRKNYLADKFYIEHYFKGVKQ